MDPIARQLWVDGREVVLSSQKFELLRYFLESGNRAINASELANAGVLRSSQGLRYKNLISELRTRLEPIAQLFQVVPGYGYRCIAQRLDP